MSSGRPTTVVLSTTLDPVAHGVLGALASLESGKGSANRVIERHLREELDELAPGLWKRVQHATADLAPRERSAAVAEMVSAHLRALADGLPP
jgi:hypothetical protein